MQALKKIVVKLLRETANNIDAGNSELTDQEAMELISVLSHKAISKESACIYMNISRSQFDNLIREGIIPKGRKRVGFKELVWYQDELDSVIIRMKKKKP